MKLAQKAVRGVAWAYGVFFGGRIFTFITTAILARLLLVEDFGLLGYALLLLGFIDATQGFGISDALIYNSEQEERTTHTAFWMSLMIGVGQYAIIYLLAPLALLLPQEAGNPPDPVVVDILRVIGLVFIINALGETHDSLLQKRLQFRKRYMPDFYSAIIKGGASIAMALIFRNVWALVLGYIVGSVVRTTAKWLLMPYRPKFEFHPARARSLWSFGGFLVLINLFGLVVYQADQAATALFVGVTQLGYFTIAVKVPEMVIANFSLILTRVLFPVFTKMKDNIAQLTEAFLTTTQFTAFVTIPAGLGMAAVAPELVLVVFGEKWVPAIGLLQVLALLGLLTSLPWSSGDMFKAVGRPDITTKILFVEIIYTVPVVFAAGIITRDAYWASAANTAVVVLTAMIRLGIAARYLKFSPLRYWYILRTPLAAGAAMVAAVTGVRWLTSPLPALVTTSKPGMELALHDPALALPYWVTLLLSIAVGGVVYAGLLFVTERQSLLDARTMLTQSLRGDRAEGDDIEADDPPTTPLKTSLEPSV